MFLVASNGSRRLCAIALVLLVLFAGTLPARAETPVAAMARMEAAERLDSSQVLSLFRGYSSRGLRLDAAALLERKLRTGEVRPDEAVPLIEHLIVEQTRRDDPETLLAICEPALRIGSPTPLILYSCGTALRLTRRFPESSAMLARVDPKSPVFPYALYAIGQIAAEKGDSRAALDVFRRVRATVEDDAEHRSLGEMATRAEAGLLLTLGRPADAAPLFETLRDETGDPLVRLGSSFAGVDNVSEGAGLPAETVAGRPVRERILLELMQGGLSRTRGRYASALAAFSRAERELDAFVGSTTPPASESVQRPGAAESLRAQIDEHRALRRSLAAEMRSRAKEKIRSDIVDLLVGLLVMDHTLTRAAGPATAAPPPAILTPVSAEDAGEIIRRIERVKLDGVEADRLVEDLARTLDTLENLAHPIQRYRLMTQLEKSHAEISAIKEKVRLRRQAALEGIESGGEASISRFLADMGRFLTELDTMRAAARGVQEVTQRHFNILRQSDEKEKARAGDGNPVIEEVLAFDRDRFVSLSHSVDALEERTRILAWERRKEELRPWRHVIHRQIVDALVAQARAPRETQSPGLPRESWAALERAASYLAGDGLSRRDAIDCAIHIGSLLSEGHDRWRPFPEEPEGEREKTVIAAILPVLSAGMVSGVRREESLFLSAILKMRLRDDGAAAEAREFLDRFPASPFAGHLAVRLGHVARLSGDGAAAALYRAAAEGPNPEASAAGRYMLGWLRFQGGDTEGATRELSPILGNSSFRCAEPRPFEQAVLSLAVRAWKELPSDRLPSYGPVRDRRCGGKLLLVSLGEAERKRGEALRAAAAHDLLSRHFLSGESAMEYGKKSVEDLVRAAKDDEAMSRALRVAEKYGPGSDWSESQRPAVRETTRAQLAEMLKAVSEREFDAGIRSGEPSAMAAAAAGFALFFELKGADISDADADLKLKWAVASLRSGERETGIDLLLELIGEQRADEVGERASVLYAEAMIAGYERKESSAEDAEESVQMLLDDFPSEKASALALRAAAAFLASGDHERAAGTAETIETNRATPKPLVHEAILIEAQASMLMNDPPAARSKAIGLLGAAGEIAPGVRERARNILDLASLKEIEARTGAEDWRGAARMLEELGGKYPDAPETPAYYLRAMRLYQRGGDSQGAVRTGLVFLERFPGREEAVDVAGNVGGFLEERKEYLKAADLYVRTAERFPKSDRAPGFLFLSASLTAEHGDPNLARKRFSSYRARYANPRWMTAYAALSAGLLGWKAGDTGSAVREIEEGIRLVEAGVEQGAPPGLADLAGKSRLAIGEYWASQFRKLKLVLPLAKSLAVKDRYFRKSLAAFEKAEREAPLEVAVSASLSSGDLLVEFGRAIIASQRPGGLKGDELAAYEGALSTRARTFFERAVNWYSGALDRLEAKEGRPDLALSVSQRLEETQRLLAGIPAPSEAR